MPTDAVGVRAVNIDKALRGQGFTLKGVKFEHHLKCAVCWRGGLFEKGHAHTACPLVAAQNKLRKQNGVQPITLEKGWINRVDDPVVEDPTVIAKGMRAEIDDLKARVAKLENAAKRKATEEVGPTPPLKKTKKTEKSEEEKGTERPAKDKGRSRKYKPRKGKSRSDSTLR